MNRNLVYLILVFLFAVIACNLPVNTPTPSPMTIPTQTHTIPASPIPSTPTSVQLPTQTTDPGPAIEINLGEISEVCHSEGSALVLLINPNLFEQIRAGLAQFEDDLCQAGYQVFELVTVPEAPPDVRAILADLYNFTQQRLTGAYLIGDFPHAYQWFKNEYTNPDIPPDTQEVISYQYYADLDGTFAVSSEHISPGGQEYSFDIHEGEMDWEIWVGLLPVYKGDHQQTVEAINRYFQKNHAYRIGELYFPRAYLEIDEFESASTLDEHNQLMSMMTDGDYAWTPFSNADNAYIFFDSPPAGLSVEQGYQALTEGVADFTSVGAHGTWYASGSIDIDWIESNPVQTIFYNTCGCSAGNLDQPRNFLSSILYSPTSTVLVAWGTTNESGGMGTNQDGYYGHNVASDLTGGKSFGQAILEHVNTPLAYPWSDSREMHFSLQVFLGDPSLTLYP